MLSTVLLVARWPMRSTRGSGAGGSCGASEYEDGSERGGKVAVGLGGASQGCRSGKGVGIVRGVVRCV